MKKILSDEDIANKLKKLVSNKQLNTGIGYKVGPRLCEHAPMARRSQEAGFTQPVEPTVQLIPVESEP